MSSIALPASCRELPILLDAGLARRRGAWLAAGLAIGLLAALIRFWNLGAVMATSDQVAMAWLVRHSFGFKWIFAHDYGPVLALMQRTWAELLMRSGVPIEEAAMRVPVALASLLQVLVTWGLVRRLGHGPGRAMLCAGVCAIVPALVCDAHYAWGYGTLWLLCGTVALWALLAYLQTHRPGLLLLGGFALFLHCLGNCFAFALPVTLMVVWATWTSNPEARPLLHRGALRWPGSAPALACASTPSSAFPRRRAASILLPFVLGFILPCLAALLVIALSWWWTGAGQLGRLLFKHEAGSTGLQFRQIVDLPAMWIAHFGYLFAIPAAAGLLWATAASRQRVLAVWCWASLLPMLLLVDWNQVGYAEEYLIEAVYAAGLLGTLWMCTVIQRLDRRPGLRAAFAGVLAVSLVHMAAGSADACLNQGALSRWTGVTLSWGAVRPESGIKAAGWYVRHFVPQDAVVMATHTNTGMEVTVAEYYCGRRVLADCDLRPEMVEPLVREMHESVDVFITDPAWQTLIRSLPGFERVATLRHQGRPVRYVYARSDLPLPHLDAEASELNERYRDDFSTRRVPAALPAAPEFPPLLARFQQVIKSLRQQPGG